MNSNDTKRIIKSKIERLVNSKRELKKTLPVLKAKFERVRDRIDSIETSIALLEQDLNG